MEIFGGLTLFNSVWFKTMENCFWTYTFQFCPINDGKGTVANDQLGGWDDVDHLLFSSSWLISKFSFPSLSADQFLNWFILFCYHTDCLDWGNFVGCRWVFSNQVPQAFLFFNKSLACFRQTFGKILKAWLRTFSPLFSFRYHRLGYGFGLAVAWRKEAFLTTWRCWRLTNRVTKLFCSKLGHRPRRTDDQYWHTPSWSLLLLWVTWFSFSAHNRLFVCLLFEILAPKYKVDLLDGEAQPQPLQFEAGIFWKGGEGEEKSRQSA